MIKCDKVLDYKQNDKQFYFLLLSAPVLITLYRYFALSKHFQAYIPSLTQSPEGIITSYKLQFLGFFLLLFLIPVLHIVFGIKKPLKEFGFSLGDMKYGSKFVLFTILFLVIPFAICGSYDPVVKTEYPMAKELIEYHMFIPSYQMFYVLFYYVAWEFYFRGYLLFGLKDRYGAFEAILIQTTSSCLIHIDKPFAEIFLSIPVGIFLGYIALRSRSFWYPFIVHAALGVLTDTFIIYLQN